MFLFYCSDLEYVKIENNYELKGIDEMNYNGIETERVLIFVYLIGIVSILLFSVNIYFTLKEQSKNIKLNFPIKVLIIILLNTSLVFLMINLFQFKEGIIYVKNGRNLDYLNLFQNGLSTFTLKRNNCIFLNGITVFFDQNGFLLKVQILNTETNKVEEVFFDQLDDLFSIGDFLIIKNDINLTIKNSQNIQFNFFNISSKENPTYQIKNVDFYDFSFNYSNNKEFISKLNT
ncbi:MAG: hypothetical protein ACK5XN_23925 [Bacteroidota bacterium]